ncbi:MAG TPA: hypothetical protein VFQ77_06035 [Pseudonocardiaceae bacterium]|jgi:hypothetical protein|nr:hypothetical protein [Pseudonocardiaceae bacterium]
METFSDSQSDRTVLALQCPDGEPTTVIVQRSRGQVWLVYHGALKTTVAMSDLQATHLIEALRAAARTPR